MSTEGNKIPQYLTDAYEKYTLQVYNHAVTFNGANQNWKPIKLTRKQKAQRWLRNKKWEMGRYLSDKANKLGYYDESY